MSVKNKSVPFLYICLGAIPLLIFIYFFSNIKGYYRFQQLCDVEEQAQFINMVEPNKGWLYNDGEPVSENSAYSLAASPNVSYVRYKNRKDNQFYDMRYKAEHPPPLDVIFGNALSSRERVLFDISPADLSKEPRYNWLRVNEKFPDELRTGRGGDRIIDMLTDEIVANQTYIYYSTFERSRTLLAAPSGNSCDWRATSLGSEHDIHLIFGPLDKGSK